MERFNITDDTLIEISCEASNVIGTSADLQEGDTLTINQLLYGLMLPSGNDAAHCLAEYFGAILKKDAEEREEKDKKEEAERQKVEEDRKVEEAKFEATKNMLLTGQG